MITVASATEQLEATVPPHQDVTRVLDVAFFWRMKREPDGSETPWWVLKKPVKGHPAGTAMPLAKLHSLLFP